MTSSSVAPLQALVFVEDWPIARSAFQQLTALGSPEVVAFYLSLLEHPNALLRNQAAYGLADIGNPEVVPALLQAIFKPEHVDNNGSIVYALVQFDCADLLEEIMLIIFYHGAEASFTANVALQDQVFNVTLAQKTSIQRHWQLVKVNPSEAAVSLGIDYLDEVLDELFEGI
ncbi:HEAT repeat domain-containing protein [Hymenobacter jeollabukensis]|uniref:HEAT repeat domain-containing protein n=1 Tax=Hymenobacter jeollabukensis TaxID=2025313 RepID=A0A5R8WR41_9BACT|nr:HEAT repeat domain-containing protein [Hymenobacter jeollabukensis]TLM93000.1 HEAT repeat domain-containing protein [Hymenobacter jeollabukensis]